jgi:hypothetical protein
MRRPLPFRATAAAVGTAALAALGANAVPAGAASTSTKSAASEYQAAVKAATNQSVHFETDITQGNVSLQQSGDAGTSSGSQSLTIRNGKFTEHMNAEVVGKTGYVNGNSAGLHNIIGLTNAQAKKYAGKWLSFPMSNAALAQLVAGLLRSQVATELGFGGPYIFAGNATVNGQKAKGIQGSVSTPNGGSVPEVLYVPATGKPLPIKEVTNPGGKAHSSFVHGAVTFSNWGEHVSVTAPTHTTSLLKLAPPSSAAAHDATTTTTTGG